MKSYFKCEIKTASRWQQVTVNKWIIATEPNHLKDWFIQEQNSCCSETQIEIIFVGEIDQKHSILCLKRKRVNIKLFFIELLYKINITFVIMLLFGEKKQSVFALLIKYPRIDPKSTEGGPSGNTC